MSEERSGVKKALQIGINYLDLPAGKGRLNGCFHDVEVMNGLLLNHYGFSAETVKILRDDDTQNLPTRHNIEEGIKWLVTGAKAGDSSVFSFFRNPNRTLYSLSEIGYFYNFQAMVVKLLIKMVMRLMVKMKL